MSLPNRSAWLAVAPATPPPESALLRPPSPLSCGHQASRPSTMARMRRRSSAVSKPQASIRRARSAGTTSDFARAIPPTTVFPGVEVARSNRVAPTFLGVHRPCNLRENYGFLGDCCVSAPNVRRAAIPCGSLHRRKMRLSCTGFCSSERRSCRASRDSHSFGALRDDLQVSVGSRSDQYPA